MVLQENWHGEGMYSSEDWTPGVRARNVLLQLTLVR